MSQNASKDLADRYLELGGKRRAVLDDNLVDTRVWEEESPQAASFWQDNVESLSKEKRKDVEKFLPGINAL